MLDSRIVTSPCAGAPDRRGSLLWTFTARILPKTFTSGTCAKAVPGGYFASGALSMLLGADRFGLVVRGQFGRQIDLTGEILAALDGVWFAGHGIFENRAFEGVLCRRLATRRLCDRPLNGQANVVVL